MDASAMAVFSVLPTKRIEEALQERKRHPGKVI
jgi:hypothetical protein